MDSLDVSNLDLAVKWAQIISPPIAAVALIIAVLNARPYRKRMSFGIKRNYDIEGNYNRCSFTLYISFSNMSLVPIIISEIKIVLKNKSGSYFRIGSFNLDNIYSLDPGVNLSVPIKLTDKREFRNEVCKANINIICTDTDGTKYKKRSYVEQNFTKFYKS